MPQIFRVIIAGRSTGRGAYTSAGGRQINTSRTGNHWDEVIEGPIGHEFIVTDISNSGKHNCHRSRIIGDNNYEIVEYADRYCQFCKT